MAVMRVMTQRMFMVEREVLSGPGQSAEKFAVVSKPHGPADGSLELLATSMYASMTPELIQTVHIRQKPTCDCIDFIRGNHPCKHVIFVLYVSSEVQLTVA